MRSVRFVGFGPLAFDLFMETSWEGSEELSKQTNRWVDIGPGGVLGSLPCGGKYAPLRVPRHHKEEKGSIRVSSLVCLGSEGQDSPTTIMRHSSRSRDGSSHESTHSAHLVRPGQSGITVTMDKQSLGLNLDN